MNEFNKLILIGNGFDLAHGLKTSYKNFLDWYMCNAFQHFYDQHFYQDSLIEIRNKYAGTTTIFKEMPNTCEEVINFISINNQQSIQYHSNFFQRLLQSLKANNWVDIERKYFNLLKAFFTNRNMQDDTVVKLNKDFDVLIVKLTEYVKIINSQLDDIPRLKIGGSKNQLIKIFNSGPESKIRFLNFNYTETLFAKGYAKENEIIHIHGRVADVDNNPIIFGYGDESDPAYQNIEDSGKNLYLEHIKSFGYFRTSNYHNLISYIDSEPYIVYIVGHSCGLSDRVLLNEIFEHENCKKIEIFYHKRNDGSDNFKEITQEISRHFRPGNKKTMRRIICEQNIRNTIPQNKV